MEEEAPWADVDDELLRLLLLPPPLLLEDDDLEFELEDEFRLPAGGGVQPGADGCGRKIKTGGFDVATMSTEC